MKEGVEILFRANEKKQLTEEQLQELKRKQEEESRVLEEMKKKVEEMKIDAHKRIIDKLNASKIRERGFSYMNEHGEIENLHTDHYTSPVHLMRIAPEFKKFCQSYKVQPVLMFLFRKTQTAC